MVQADRPPHPRPSPQVGYGDITPVTTAERIVAMVVMLLGANTARLAQSLLSAAWEAPLSVHVHAALHQRWAAPPRCQITSFSDERVCGVLLGGPSYHG